jgi:penicillin-binding protein 2
MLLTRRAALLAAGQGLLGAALVARLYQLQILESDRYTLLAEENRINLRLLAPVRGRILDRFGVTLADNGRSYCVVVVPEQAGDLDAMLRALSSVIQLDDAEQRRVIREARRKHSFVPVVVRTNLSWREVAHIEAAVPELPGVSIEEGLARNYPYGALAAHVLGYVAAVSDKDLTGDPLLELPDFRIGKSGVE